MYLFGVEVNFNALRTEAYSTHSRIPVMVTFTLSCTEEQSLSSSPLEDAMRRDFTVNSLFYKIDSRT